MSDEQKKSILALRAERAIRIHKICGEKLAELTASLKSAHLLSPADRAALARDLGEMEKLSRMIRGQKAVLKNAIMRIEHAKKRAEAQRRYDDARKAKEKMR